MADVLPLQEQEELRLAMTRPRMPSAARTQAAAAYAAVAPAFQRLAAAEGRYDYEGDLDGLDEALRTFESVDGTPAWRALAADRRADWGRRACLIYRGRYEETGAEDDLRRAVATAGTAAEAAAAAAAAADDAEAAMSAVAALVTARTGAPVEATLPAVRQAMGREIEEARAQVAEIEPTVLAVLGEQLTGRFDRDRRHGDADRAVDVLRRARSLRAELRIEPDAAIDVRLGGALILRFKYAGARADIDEAVAVLREGVEHAGDDPDRARALDGLGCALLARSEHAASGDDLAEAVERLSEAVALKPASPWFRANLGTALVERFGRQGDRADGARAVELLESALATIPPSAPDRRRIEQNVLAARHTFREPGAATLSTRALVDATPEGARGRPGRMGALALDLVVEAERTLDLTSLDEAVRTAAQALDATAPGAVDRPSIVHALGRALATRFAVLGADADLDDAIGALAEAAHDSGHSAAERPDFLLTLAEARSMRAARTGAPQDAEVAEASFFDACTAGEEQNATAARRAAAAWLAWAAEEGAWDAAAEAGRRAMVAVDRIHRVQFGRENREAMLGGAGFINADAAIAFVRSGQPAEALLALEHGRARLLSAELERDRAELDALVAAGRGDLAEAFLAAARSVSGAERAGDASTVREADAVLRAVAGEIRRVPGHDAFLQQVGVDELLRIGGEAPLVYVAAGLLGATVVAAVPGGEVRARLLDGVDAYVVGGLVDDYLAALKARCTAPHAWRGGLDAVGEALGAMLWPALLSVLGGVDRAVLVPAGLFGLLPVQIAWWRDPLGRRYAIDAFELSFAPNARTIAACRRLAATADAGSVLTVAAPERTDVAPLPLARAESDGVRSAFAVGEQVAGPQAMKAEVLGALHRHGVYHFACHGRSTPDRPLDSALLLAGDDALRVRDLLETPLPGARLAVLSACETAVIGRRLVDEVIGLPTGFLQAGVAGVIGTSWEVGDESAALLVRRFFDTWDSERPAAALRAAQRWLRESTNADKRAAYPDIAAAPPEGLDAEDLEDWGASRDHAGIERWGAFVHTGA
ncbi:CHAT domain-containing protein [Pseudonocardia sp. T1-2H]|uniref:CHAT domain-containing protein n=1 Tax=Pseudonocardia sp. T1-2H TaxID=3128899 RepID=UPI003101A00C